MVFESTLILIPRYPSSSLLRTGLKNMFSKLLLTILIASNIISPTILHSGEVLGSQNQHAGDKVEESMPQKINIRNLNVKISAQAGIAVDKQTGKILFAKNIHSQRSMASITKLITALVFLDLQPDLERTIKLTMEDMRQMGQSRLDLDEEVKIKNLLYTALIASDNASTMAVVRSTGLSQQKFVEQMNQKVIDMGLSKTSLADPVGLNENNISTAFEINLILRQAFKNKLIAKILAMENYSFTSLSDNYHHIKSTNKLLGSYLNIFGGKTGYTEEAGYCFTGLIKLKNKQEIITVVLGADEEENRFQDTKAIVNWVETNYQW